MPISLRPRFYKQGMSWNMMPKYKIDTVTFRPRVNGLLTPSVVHSEEITSVTMGSHIFQLPLANGLAPNVSGSAYNNRDGDNYASGQVQAITVSGSFTYQVEHPLPTMPTATLEFEGTTHYVNRRSLQFDEMESRFWNNSNIAPAIVHVSDGSESWNDSKSRDSYNRGALLDSTLVDYTRSSIPLFPFVKVVRAAGSGMADFQQNKLTEEEVLTHWMLDHETMGGTGIITPNWSNVNHPDAWLTWDSYAYTEGSIEPLKVFNFQRASFVNRTIPITTEVIKITDYEYRINWSAPVRYAYHSESRTYVDTLIDSYAFIDHITKITVQVTASEMNTDTVDLSLGMIQDTLTADVTNNYPVSFGANEFITVDAYDQSQTDIWMFSLSRIILNKYKNGKYIVECDVYVDWAIANNIKINSQMYVAQQDGTFIARDGVNVLFEVKAIEKSFNSNEFIYTLKLLEV